MTAENPKHLDMVDGMARLLSFCEWPSGKGQTPDQLAKAGFFFNGVADRVTCFFCDVSLTNWVQEDEPWYEHARWSPTCKYVVDNKGEAFIEQVLQRELTNEHESKTPKADVSIVDEERSSERINCHMNPTMADKEARIASFCWWPSGKSQTPEQLATAGFFFTGRSDTVVCFSCGVRLNDWEQEDEPWYEHARWFPTCSHVRQSKGDDFVEHVLARENESSERSQIRQGSGQTRTGSEYASVSSSRNVHHSIDLRVLNSSMESLLVREVVNMDIPTELVRQAVEQRLLITGKNFADKESLLQSVLQLTSNQEHSPTHSANGNTISSEEASSSLVNEIRKLKDERTCKVCMSEEVCFVFVPCGHFVCCGTCTQYLENCPLCRSVIKSAVRTYLS